MKIASNNFPPIRVSSDRHQAAFRNKAAASALFAGVAAAASLVLFAQHSSQTLHPADLLRQVDQAAALAAMMLAARWFPAPGPRYGEKVSLRPLAALLGVVLLPPVLAVAPTIVAGLIALALDRDSDDRLAAAERALLLVAAQLATCAAISCLALNFGSIWPPHVIHALAYVYVAEAAIFVAFYLCGLSLSIRQASRSISTGSSRSVMWRVTWVNESVVVLIGSPFALMAGWVFQKTTPAIGTAFAAVMTAAAVLVARALVDGKMMRRQLHAVDRLTQQAAIGKSPSIERFLTDFVEHCGRLILYDRATVWLQNEQDLVLEKALEYVGRSIGFQPDVRRSGEELVGRVAERGRAILVDDVRVDVRHRISSLPERDKAAMGRVSAMLIPLLAAGDLVGVVEFERFAAATYTRHDRERVQSLAGLVAMSLANNRQHQDVVQQAVTDGLTGLYNKRQILKTLSDETARAQRYGNALSVLMLDIDAFKQFNDTYGHMQGDLLLQSLSGLIKQSIRTSDIGGRYGGEEFVVVMPETGREAAWVTAERIRARVEAERFAATVNYESAIGLQEATQERAPHSVAVQRTVSIGVATFPTDAFDAQDLLVRADESLYAAKNAGRNRIVLSGSLGESQPRTIAPEPLEAEC